MLKQNSPIKSFQLKSFQLFEGKTQTKTLGLILIIGLFFIGIIVWVWIKVNNDIDKANQNSVGIDRKNDNGSKFFNSVAKEQIEEIERMEEKNQLTPLSEEKIQSQLRELETLKNNSKPLSEKEIQEQLKELENLRKK